MNEKYIVYSEDFPQDLTLRELSTQLENKGYPEVWSARIGTGLFGLTSCPAGNKGPKSRSEVLLGVGEYGLNTLIEYGFLPCPVCKPLDTNIYPDIWKVIEFEATDRYSDIGIEGLKKIPYDIRELDLEFILVRTKEAPERFYLPEGLSDFEVQDFVSRLSNFSVTPKKLGFYDPSSETNFTEYAF